MKVTPQLKIIDTWLLIQFPSSVIRLWLGDLGAYSGILSDGQWCSWNLRVSCSRVLHVWKTQWQDWCVCFRSSAARASLREETYCFRDCKESRKLDHVGKNMELKLMFHCSFVMFLSEKNQQKLIMCQVKTWTSELKLMFHWSFVMVESCVQAKPRLESKDLRSILDPNLRNIDEAQMQRMALAAALCLTQSARLRPKMHQVTKMGLDPNLMRSTSSLPTLMQLCFCGSDTWYTERWGVYGWSKAKMWWWSRKWGWKWWWSLSRFKCRITSESCISWYKWEFNLI